MAFSNICRSFKAERFLTKILPPKFKIRNCLRNPSARNGQNVRTVAVTEGSVKSVDTTMIHRGHSASHSRTLPILAVNTDESVSAIQEAGAQSLKTVIAAET